MHIYKSQELSVLPYFDVEGFDPHIQTKEALREYHVDVSRQDAKNLNYALIYGVGPGRLLSMAPGLGTISAAKATIAAFFDVRPALLIWHQEVIEGTRVTGYAEDFFGPRRYLPAIWSGITSDRLEAERQAINQEIQGTGASIIKIALRRVWEEVSPPLAPGSHVARRRCR